MVGGAHEEHNTSVYMLSVPPVAAGTVKDNPGGDNASGFLPTNLGQRILHQDRKSPRVSQKAHALAADLALQNGKR